MLMKGSYSKEHRKRDWIIVYSGLFKSGYRTRSQAQETREHRVGGQQSPSLYPYYTDRHVDCLDFTHISTISISETFTSGLTPSRYSCSFSVKATAYL